MQANGVRLHSRTPVVLELARGRVVWVDDGEGLELVCQAGTLWVTEGRYDDAVLHAGQRLRVGGDRRALVHAMADARLTVRPAPPSHPSTTSSP